MLQGLMVAAVLAVAGFGVARLIDAFRLVRVTVAAFALAGAALVLDALGLHAAGWVALALILALFVLGTSCIFLTAAPQR